MTVAPIDRSLVARIEEIARAPRLLVALDFDGTVSPIAPKPNLARPHPRSARAIHTLVAMPDTVVAYVSGRSVASLRIVSVAPEGVLLVGSHGAEIVLPGQQSLTPAGPEEADTLAALDAILRSVVEASPGTWVEKKPFGFALHTRGVDPVLAERAIRSAIDAVGRELPGITVREGKSIAEFATRSETKGDAIRVLQEYTAADAVFYAGDDLTDEDAFAVLGDGDLGVHSGVGATLAAFSVAGPDSIADVLEALAQARLEVVGSALHGGAR